MLTLDRTDSRLLELLQEGLSIVAEPYREISGKLDIPHHKVLERIAQLKERGLIRRLSGFFRSEKLGYHSVLCAVRVPEERIGRVSELLDAVPGVTHNYLREHALNMWFTLIYREEAEAERVIRDIEQSAGTSRVFRFPRTQTFKIRAAFPFGETPHEIPAVEEAPLSTTENQINPALIPLVRLLQAEFPLCERPFLVIAEKLRVSEQEAMCMTATLRRDGQLKRIAAALYHTRAGFRVNSMVVWDVPEVRLQAAADAVTPFPQVTHCYARSRAPEFDYNFYTMVHETSKERLAQLLSEMESKIMPAKFCSLKTLRELKKTGMQYFMEKADETGASNS